MSNKINANMLYKSISSALNEYREDIEKEVQENVDEITKDVVEELKLKSPRGKGKRKSPYHKGWSIRINSKKRYRYSKAVWNKTNYQLTHLLEFGHTTIDGKRTKAIEHIRPIEKKYREKFIKKIKNSCKRGE